MKLKQGFTLIELLVVIAIIGILSSVVLASLNSARSKGGDAAVKANLTGIRAQAELYQDTNNHYGAESVACNAGMFTDTNITQAINAAVAAGGGAALCKSSDGTTATSNATSWAISVPLKSTTSRFCVDSSGNATTTLSTGGATVPTSVTTATAATCQQ